ncbi:MAG: hypothetical protein SF052_00165 [Bacteroidia bacterium]|nr:hypothetical protein [Bacteroidia bacterium]
MKVLITCCILFSTLVMHAQVPLTGIWDMGQDNTKIEITENNGIYQGRIVSSDNTNAKIGNLILKEVKSVGGKWKGKLYSPKKKEWFDAVLEVKGGKLMVTVKSGWMSKVLTWSKE